MLGSQRLIDEVKSDSILSPRVMELQFDKKRTVIAENLIRQDLSWKDYQKIFKELGALVKITGSLEDIKLWFTFFKKAVEFNQSLKDQHTSNANHAAALIEEWRALRDAHSDLLSRLSMRLHEHPESNVLTNSFIAAVDYTKELAYPAFKPDPLKDVVVDIMNEQYVKEADKLRWKQRLHNAKSWCCLFGTRNSSEEAIQNSAYVAFDQDLGPVTKPMI
jgi:hypothetical protein